MSGNNNSGTKTTVNQDPVSQTKIWKEVLYKEAKLLKIRTEFSVNPKSLTYIAPKPTQSNPFRATQDLIENFPLLNTTDEKTRQITDQLRTTVAKFELDPRQKHQQPQSTSMEIGWFHGIPQFEIKQAQIDDSMETTTNDDTNHENINVDNSNNENDDNDGNDDEISQISQSIVNQNSKRWHYPLGQSSITKFAQHYTLTMGHGPFARKEKPGAAPTK